MKITSHTAGGYCPCSSAGTVISYPLQLKQGADMQICGEVTTYLLRLASLAQHQLFWVLWSVSSGLFQSKWTSLSCTVGIKELLFAHCVWQGMGKPVCGRWEHRGQAWVGIDGSFRLSVCIPPAFGVGAEACPAAKAVKDYLWVRSFGKWQRTHCLLTKVLALAWARAAGLDKGNPIQTKKLFSSTCCVFTKVWRNVDQV